MLSSTAFPPRPGNVRLIGQSVQQLATDGARRSDLIAGAPRPIFGLIDARAPMGGRRRGRVRRCASCRSVFGRGVLALGIAGGSSSENFEHRRGKQHSCFAVRDAPVRLMRTSVAGEHRPETGLENEMGRSPFRHRVHGCAQARETFRRLFERRFRRRDRRQAEATAPSPRHPPPPPCRRPQRSPHWRRPPYPSHSRRRP